MNLAPVLGAVAVALPLLAAVLALAVPGVRPRAVEVAMAGSALVWIGVGLTGDVVSLRALQVDAFVAMACAGTALSWRPPEAGRRPRAPMLALAALAVPGTAVVLVALLGGEGGALPGPGGEFLTPSTVTAVVVAATAAMVAGTIVGPGPLTVLVPAGAAVALRALTMLEPGGTTDLRSITLVLAAAAVGAVLLRRPPLALVLFGVAVAGAGPDLVPAGTVLAAAGVLSAAADHPTVLLAAVPGGAAVVSMAVASGEGTVVAVASMGGALAVVMALSVARLLPLERGRRSTVAQHRPDDEPRAPEKLVHLLASPTAAVAAMAALWLFVAPDSWSFAGPVGLVPYDAGAAQAVAAGLLAAAFWETLRTWRQRSTRAPVERAVAGEPSS